MASIDEMLRDLAEIKENTAKESTQLDQKETQLRRHLSQDVQTRSNLTYYFLGGFFALIVGCFLFVIWYNSLAVSWIQQLNDKGLSELAGGIKLLELDKVLSIIIGALGTSLGFIVGYYFKEKSN
ncbi:TPA: hypothetical protein ACF2WN_000221 [Escherichia coli]|nr:hypothetical protein [Escherichia coli]HCJ5599848.1 hypothetical protein [Escherichia coli]